MYDEGLGSSDKGLNPHQRWCFERPTERNLDEGETGAMGEQGTGLKDAGEEVAAGVGLVGGKRHGERKGRERRGQPLL